MHDSPLGLHLSTEIDSLKEIIPGQFMITFNVNGELFESKEVYSLERIEELFGIDEPDFFIEEN